MPFEAIGAAAIARAGRAPTIGRMVAVDRPQIQSFRLERHHLNRRLPAGGLVDATAACGIQETPKLTAALALHARVDDVTVADVARALNDKTLLTVWAMRGAPYVVPTAEAAIFTAGALPVGEDSWRRFFGGWATSLSERDARSPHGAAGSRSSVRGPRRMRAGR